jgi:hypothetical protein
LLTTVDSGRFCSVGSASPQASPSDAVLGGQLPKDRECAAGRWLVGFAVSLLIQRLLEWPDTLHFNLAFVSAIVAAMVT